jgi:hypothetical protein
MGYAAYKTRPDRSYLSANPSYGADFPLPANNRLGNWSGKSKKARHKIDYARKIDFTSGQLPAQLSSSINCASVRSQDQIKKYVA